MEDERVKFKVKADLAVYETIQRDGRLSEEAIAKRTNTPATTVHYAMDRIRKRDFYKIRAVPRLERFQHIPMAIVGFSEAHPVKLKQLVEQLAKTPEVVQCLHSETDIFLHIMDVSADALAKRLYELMEQMDEKPRLYIRSPRVAKWETAIPDKVLEAVYGDLADRRTRL